MHKAMSGLAEHALETAAERASRSPDEVMTLAVQLFSSTFETCKNSQRQSEQDQSATGIQSSDRETWVQCQ